MENAVEGASDTGRSVGETDAGSRVGALEVKRG